MSLVIRQPSVPKKKLFKILKNIKKDFKLEIKKEIESEIEFRYKNNSSMLGNCLKLSKTYERSLRYIYNDDLENANEFFTKHKELGSIISLECFDDSHEHYYLIVNGNDGNDSTDEFETGEGHMKKYLDGMMEQVKFLERYINNFTSINCCLNGTKKKVTIDEHTFIAI